MAAYVLAIDQGTTSTRAILFHADTSIASFARAIPQIFRPTVRSSTSPRICGQRRSRPPEAPCAMPAQPPKTSRPSVSPISGRPRWFGTARPAGPCIGQSSGKTGGLQVFVRGSRPKDTRLRCRKDRPFAGPLFLRHEGRLAAAERCGERDACRARRTRVRNRRQLFAVAYYRRQGSRHRRNERVAHLAVRHSSRAMG